MMVAQKDNSTYPYALAFILVFILGAELLVGNWQQGNKASQNLGFVDVSAIGYAYGIPSQAVVYITVNGSGDISAKAVSSLSSTLATLNSTLLRYVNNNMSQIQTDSLSVYQQPCAYYTTIYPQAQPPVAYCNQTQYKAQEQIAVTLPNTSKVSAFVGNVSLIQNVLVSSVNAKLSNAQTTSLRDIALKNALSNATEQAGILANNANLTLVNVSVNSYYAYPLGFGTSGNAKYINGPEFYPGKYQLSETVSAQFSYVR